MLESTALHHRFDHSWRHFSVSICTKMKSNNFKFKWFNCTIQCLISMMKKKKNPSPFIEKRRANEINLMHNVLWKMFKFDKFLTYRRHCKQQWYMCIMYRFYCVNNQIGDDYSRYIEIYRQTASFFFSSTITLWHLAQKNEMQKESHRKWWWKKNSVKTDKKVKERMQEREREGNESDFASFSPHDRDALRHIWFHQKRTWMTVLSWTFFICCQNYKKNWSR